MRIIRELINTKPSGQTTDISQALKYFNKMVKKKSTAFVLSDFKSENYSEAIKVSARKHDVVALMFTDPAEYELPNIGLARIKDIESGQFKWVNTSSKKNRKKYHKNQLDLTENTKKIFNKSNIDFTEIKTDQDYIKPLMNLFKRRV